METDHNRSLGTHKRSASLSEPPRGMQENDEVPSIFSGQKKTSPSKLRLNPISPPTSPSQALRSRSSSVGIPGSRRESGTLSPDMSDRVFPMRSFVSVEPTPTSTSQLRAERRGDYFSLMSREGRARTESMSRTSSGPGITSSITGPPGEGQLENKTGDQAGFGSGDAARKASSGADRYRVGGAGQGYSITSDTASAKSWASDGGVGQAASAGKSPSITSVRAGKEQEDPGGLVTARFKHVVTEGGHAVITGRDGETLQRCEDEPIHIPGAIQSFGILIALQEESEGRLVVRVVSENAKRVLGFSPRQLFALNSFADILSEEQAENLLDHIDFIRDEGTDVEQNGPEVFTLSIRSTQRRLRKVWCAVHISPSDPDSIICEFELEDDAEFPLTAPNEQTPEPPEDTLSSTPTEQELKESTETTSRPLRVLRSARKRKGEAAAMEVFNIMSQVQEQLAGAANLDTFLKILVGIVKELSGFHRVMVYQFDQQWNGKVVTELVDPHATKDLYKGLHFPASDIPKQARDLYRINRVRLLYDRDHETARLVCRTVEDLQKPLDLTHSYLRAMSPIHIKYLGNMAVRSSMSISINAFNELWGLISCHTYGSRGTRVSFPIRKMCRLVGDFASRNIERLSYASRLNARKLINTAPTNKNPSGYIIASSDDLLKLFDADFGLLSIHGETKVLGKLDATQEALAMLEYLRFRSFTSVLTSTDICEDFPDLKYPPGFKALAGQLLVPLSTDGSDFIVFFRKGVLREVKWAGNPYEKYIKEGTEGYLEPRKSFKTWSEQVIGRCRDWTEEELETAAVLCLVYGKFIEVWRQKEAALENSHLTKLLLANSAHEVRTPLNAIINYLEIAMEGSLDQETRDNLSRSHSASKSLIYVINDLLDLTKTEAGGELVRDESFNIRDTFREAVDMFRSEASRKGIEYNVLEHVHLPKQVLGDSRRVRQAITNLVDNAVGATTQGSVTIEISVTGRGEHHADVEIVVEDTGVGMSSQKTDLLFTQMEQIQAEPQEVIEDTIAPDTPKSIEKEGKQALGLGLAVVARIVKNMNGQLRVKSEEGKGSRFVILLPFSIPETEDDARLIGTGEEVTSPASEAPQDAFRTHEEMTLIGASTSRRHSIDGEPDPARGLFRRSSENSIHSNKSLNSLKSVKSGRSVSSVQSGKSDVDRLIEAMQEPHMVEGPSSERPPTSSWRRRHPSGHISWGTPPGSLSKRNSGSLGEPSTKSPQETSTGHRSIPSSPPTTSGQKLVPDSSQPIRPVKVPDVELTQHPEVVTRNVEESVEDHALPQPESGEPLDASSMHVLVAEDDPINSKIVEKRMQKVGHEIYLTVNGDECASAYGEKPAFFDVVLMDMQVSYLSGLGATE